MRKVVSPPHLLSIISLAWLVALLLTPTMHSAKEAFWGTAGLLFVNAAVSWWTAVAKRRIPILLNCIQLALFVVINYQLAQAYGQDHFSYEHQPRYYDWVEFLFSHVPKTADVLHGIDLYGVHVQTITHKSTAAASVLVCMHISTDFFLLSVFFRWLRKLWADEQTTALPRERRLFNYFLVTLLCLAAVEVQGWWEAWSWQDRLLWPLDNFLRAVDLMNLMGLFHWQLHGVKGNAWNLGLAVALRLTALVWLAELILYARLAVFSGWGYTLDELMEHLSDGSTPVRRTAAYALGRSWGDASLAVPALVGALEDYDDGVRIEAVHSLGRIGPNAEEAVPALSDTVWRGRTPHLRRHAIKALGRIGRGARVAASDLCFLWQISEGAEQPLIEEAIRRIAPETICTLRPSLLKVASSPPLADQKAPRAGTGSEPLTGAETSANPTADRGYTVSTRASTLPIGETKIPVAGQSAAASSFGDSVGVDSTTSETQDLSQAVPRPSRRVSIVSRILELHTTNFFCERRTVQQIKEELAARGHGYALSSLYSPLATLTKRGDLGRSKDERGRWLYSEPAIMGKEKETPKG